MSNMGSHKVSRRVLLGGLGALPSISVPPAFSQTANMPVEFLALNFPSFDALEKPDQFGYQPPTPEQLRIASEVLASVPTGPTPLAIAQWFVTEYKSSPDVISQWPESATWNPLIVEFFKATTTKANNDMIAWCAAFANWCLQKAGRTGLMTDSASSQSFLKPSLPRTSSPKSGDIAVFTCYDTSTGESIGLGHVTFFKEEMSGSRIAVIGGNQSADGHASIISEGILPTSGIRVRRHVNQNYQTYTMRLNTYISVT